MARLVQQALALPLPGQAEAAIPAGRAVSAAPVVSRAQIPARRPPAPLHPPNQPSAAAATIVVASGALSAFGTGSSSLTLETAPRPLRRPGLGAVSRPTRSLPRHCASAWEATPASQASSGLQAVQWASGVAGASRTRPRELALHWTRVRTGAKPSCRLSPSSPASAVPLGSESPPPPRSPPQSPPSPPAQAAATPSCRQSPSAPASAALASAVQPGSGPQPPRSAPQSPGPLAQAAATPSVLPLAHWQA